MKANVTLKFDTELLREARILAAEEDSEPRSDALAATSF
jgi:hypothetical protein